MVSSTLTITVQNDCFCFVGFSCDWECSPIKSCGVIYSDLVIAKEARQNQDTQLLNKVIR